MVKTYIVKNATFVFDDEIKFKKKTFNYNPDTYDELEASKEFTDDIERSYEKTKNIFTVMFVMFGMCFVALEIMKGLKASSIVVTSIFVPTIFFLLLSGIYGVKPIFDRRDIIDFYDKTAPIEFVVNCLRYADKIKEFDVMTYDREEPDPLLYIEFEDDSNITSSYEDFCKDYKFDEANYRKHSQIEINMINRTIRSM